MLIYTNLCDIFLVTENKCTQLLYSIPNNIISLLIRSLFQYRCTKRAFWEILQPPLKYIFYELKLGQTYKEEIYLCALQPKRYICRIANLFK